MVVKAAVLYEPNTPLVVEEIEQNQPRRRSLTPLSFP